MNARLSSRPIPTTTRAWTLAAALGAALALAACDSAETTNPTVGADTERNPAVVTPAEPTPAPMPNEERSERRDATTPPSTAGAGGATTPPSAAAGAGTTETQPPAAGSGGTQRGE